MRTDPPEDEAPHAAFPGEGELARLTREKDWSVTDLGAVATWSQSLRSALSICLGSRFPIALYWGRSLTLLYNDAWSPIPGNKHPWALGMPGREVWPEIWETIGPMFEGVMTTGESVYFEDALLAMRRHGYTEECYFNYSFAPVRGEGGRVEGVFNAVIETTFRVVSERRSRVLRELGERLAVGGSSSAEEICRVAVAILSAASHDVPFCALYLGKRGEPRVGLVAVAGLPPSSAAVPEVIDAGGGPPTWPWGEVRQAATLQLVDDLAGRFGFTFPGGAWPEAADAAVVAPVLESGQAVGFLLLGVNPRRAFDDAYREFVERAVSVISAAVANANAYEAERRRLEALAEIDRAKTAFFSNVSHEFRTPLTLMLGPQEEALRSANGSLEGEELRAVHRNTLRLLKLVNSLLDFSRLEAGRAQASYEPVDIAALTADLASVFRSAIERGGVAFEVNCSPVGEPVYVDRDMWEKIVLNLLSNAFKFTLEGAIKVGVRASPSLPGRFTLTIEDTGAGIPAAELPRIFERFHRIEGSRARTHEGSGIGLALVHDLVSLHGGHIEITSEVGLGTAFHISIPTGKDHLPPDRLKPGSASALPTTAATTFVAEALRWLPEDAPASNSPGPAQPAAGDSPRRILVADDNRDMRDYLRRLLEPLFSVETAADGVEALGAARARRPALIVTDVMMPNLDGFGLLTAVRNDPGLREVPVVLLSARAGDEARVEGLQVGANDYLVKPFSGRELVARLETQLALADLRAKSERERDHLFALLDGAPFALVVYEGPTHKIVVQNAAARENLGRSAIGLSLAEAVPEARDTALRAAIAQVFRTGAPATSVEVSLQRIAEDGSSEERFFTTTRQALRDERGAIWGVIAAGFDVTEQVRARQVIERSHREREKLLAQLGEASRAKDEFLAMLGHELRNPLAPILTALQVMGMREGSAFQKERAIIDRQVRHMVGLVDDLLEVSRIARGKVTLSPAPLDIEEALAKAIEIASPLFEQRKHTLDLEIAPGLAVEGDLTRLAQVFANLLTNAAKYTPSGGTVTVRARGDEGDVVVSVRDNGIGMHPEMLPRVFDLFTQERQALDRSQGGLGLGLAIVRSLVEAHGGQVTARSEGPDRGSEFIVRLPATAARPRVAEPAPPPLPKAEGGRDAF